jgi:hypothetical protein
MLNVVMPSVIVLSVIEPKISFDAYLSKAKVETGTKHLLTFSEIPYEESFAITKLQ